MGVRIESETKGVGIDADFLRSKISDVFGSIPKFAEQIHVDANSVRQWLSKKTKPEGRRIFEIVEALNLPSEEIQKLMGVPEVHVDFRKPYKNVPTPDSEESAKRLATTFFNLDPNRYVLKGVPLTVKSSTDSLEVANHIRGILGFEHNEPVTFHKIIDAAKRVNLNLFFIPFGKMNISYTEKRDKEAAFLAERDDSKIIFLDTELTIDRLTFNLCHEIAHIVVDEELVRDRTRLEKFCNAIGQELVYPVAYLKQNKDIREVFSDKSTASWTEKQAMAKALCREFNWSCMGLALALTSHRFIKKDGPTARGLFKIQGIFNKQDHNSEEPSTIDERYFQHFEPGDFDSLETFFKTDVESDADIYLPFITLKEAATFERITYRRLSEILGIDSGEADELVQMWMRQVENDGEVDEANE